MFVEKGEGAGTGIIDRYRERVVLHDVFNAGCDIADEFRERGTEAIQNGIDTIVRISAARSDVTFLSGSFFEGSVREGGTNGIGIGVFVTDDISRRRGTSGWGAGKWRGDGH